MRRGKPWNYIALEIQKVHQNTSFCYLTSPFKLITKKQKQQQKRNKEKDEKKQNHSTQDSRVVPHRGTNCADQTGCGAFRVLWPWIQIISQMALLPNPTSLTTN